MSENDLIHLEANFQNWCETRADELNDIDPFLYYCVDNYMKGFNLSDEEITYGIVDGGNDGGVDALYFFVNRSLVKDDTDVPSKGDVKVHLVILQVKGKTGFSP